MNEQSIESSRWQSKQEYLSKLGSYEKFSFFFGSFAFSSEPFVLLTELSPCTLQIAFDELESFASRVFDMVSLVNVK